MREERYKYFDDEELEALMEEVERSGMIAPPVYLKELIMGEAVHVGDSLWENQVESQGKTVHVGNVVEGHPEETHGKTVHVGNAVEGHPEETHGKMMHVGNVQERCQMESQGKAGTGKYIRESARRQFWIYSFKIAAAAAAAVISLTVVPMDFTGDRMAEDNHIERQIEKDVERYQEAKRDALRQEENEKSGLGGRFGNRIWSGLSDWLGMEE